MKVYSRGRIVMDVPVGLAVGLGKNRNGESALIWDYLSDLCIAYEMCYKELKRRDDTNSFILETISSYEILPNTHGRFKGNMLHLYTDLKGDIKPNEDAIMLFIFNCNGKSTANYVVDEKVLLLSPDCWVIKLENGESFDIYKNTDGILEEIEN